jgi:Tol biopolymer transport system component
MPHGLLRFLRGVALLKESFRDKAATALLLAIFALSSWVVRRAEGQLDCTSNIDSQGRVLFFATRTLYAEASRAAPTVTQFSGGTLLNRMGGPVCNDLDLWLPVEVGGRRGWVLERENNQRYVEPFIGKPDGKPRGRPQGQIAFGVANWGTDHRLQHSIYLVSADGSMLKLLVENLSQPTEVRWSPDGTAILFQSYAVPPKAWDYTSERHIQRLKVAADGTATGKPARLVQGFQADFSPVWSPDGQHILFMGLRKASADGNQHMAVYVVRPDGSGLQQLSTLPASPFSNVDWSRDSRRIAFGSFQGTFTPLVSVPAEGRGQAITYTVGGKTTYTVCNLARSPVEDSIAANVSLTTDCVGGSKPYFAARGSTELMPLPEKVDGNLYAWGQRWSPAGERYAYTRELPATPAQVFTYDPHGDNLAQITVSPDAVEPKYDFSLVTDPVWSDDGQWLAVVWFRRGSVMQDVPNQSNIYLVDAGSNVMLPVLVDNARVPDITNLAWRPGPPK